MQDVDDLYQNLIIDHGRHPKNHREMDDATGIDEAFNPMCGDHYTVYLKQESDTIEDLSFTGQGCAISMASASLMTTLLKGKTQEEGTRIKEAFLGLARTGEFSPEDEELLGKLLALSGVYRFPMRVKCATLAWHSLEAIWSSLEGNEVKK